MIPLRTTSNPPAPAPPLASLPAPVRSLAARASVALRDDFHSSPMFAAAAPGRVNLIGEHTDYSDGFVFPLAIDLACVAVAAPAADPSRSRLLALDAPPSLTPLVSGLDLRSPILPEPFRATPASWALYPLGVVDQFQRALAASHDARHGERRVPNLDIVFASSVPVGGGLSSSAAIETATLCLLEQVTSTTIAPLDRARLCQHAEHAFPLVPCGMMDQLASVFGLEHHALLIDCRDCSVRPVPLPPDADILIINSNVRHSLASGEYAERRRACEAAARALAVPALRDVPLHALSSLASSSLPDDQRRAVEHVVRENARTVESADILASAALAASSSAPAPTDALRRFGALMRQSHESLRDVFRVSCPELDFLAESAWSTPGVFGARLTGGGFGGCIVALVHPTNTADASLSICRDYENRFHRQATPLVVRPARGCLAFDPSPPA